MATISNVTLTIANDPTNPSRVKLTVTYVLAPNGTEVLARSVYNEQITILGRDVLPLDPDDVLASFPVQQFAATEPRIRRQRELTVPKSRLNEDVGQDSRGSELNDEIAARVTLTYAANPPIPPALPPAAFSATQVGWWV